MIFFPLCDLLHCNFQVWREKNILKPAPGKRHCNCRNEVYHKQIGPGMFQQMTEQVNIYVKFERMHVYVCFGPCGSIFCATYPWVLCRLG